MIEDDRLLTTRDVAELLNVEVGWVYRARHKGVLPSVVIGPRTVRFRSADIRKVIREGTDALQNESDPSGDPGRTEKNPRVGRGRIPA